jgi:hypothetical protein
MNNLQKFLLVLKLFAVQSLPYTITMGTVEVTIALVPKAPVPETPAA